MNRKQIKFIITSVSGNILEWYDFVLYGYFATIFAKLFFPTGNPFLSLMIAFSVFAGGFLTRPFGGVIFGHLGDKHGRRTALVSSIMLILIPTAAIGLMPTYRAIGLAAPIALILCRLLQGLAVSGEFTGAGIFLIECAPHEKKGYYGSLITATAFVGMLLASGVSAAVLFWFTPAQIENFAWRIPFIISLFLGIGAMILRMQCEESPLFQKLKQDNLTLKWPIYHVIKKFPGRLFFAFLLSNTIGVGVYLVVAYFPSYFISHQFVGLQGAMEINSFGFLTMTVSTILMGKLADKIGLKKVAGFGAVAFLLAAYPIFNLAAKANFQSAAYAMILMGIVISPLTGAAIALVVESLPGNMRYSGVSLSWNTGMVVFGGTVPLVALEMSKAMGSESAPAIYLMFSAILTLIGVIFLTVEQPVTAAVPASACAVLVPEP